MSGTKKPKIIVEDYDYLMRRQKMNETIWMCQKYYHPLTERCKVKIITKGNEAQIFGIHNHAPNTKIANYKNYKLSRLVTIYRCPNK